MSAQRIHQSSEVVEQVKARLSEEGERVELRLSRKDANWVRRALVRLGCRRKGKKK